MGRLIICRGQYAQNPFYLSQIGKNIYSIEELCYYFYHDTYLLDRELMNSDLISFLDDELGFYDLSKVLSNIVKNNGSFTDFIAMILRECGVYSTEDTNRILNEVRENDKLDKKEKMKKRADYLAQNGMYEAAIHEYEKVLKSGVSTDIVLQSALNHNIGCCYAGMFMFRQASEFFERAHKLNGKNESLFQQMAALRLCMPENDYRDFVLEDLNKVNLSKELEEQLVYIQTSWQSSPEYEKLKNIEEYRNTNHTLEYYQKQEQLVNEFREEFRKSENETV